MGARWSPSSVQGWLNVRGTDLKSGNFTSVTMAIYQPLSEHQAAPEVFVLGTLRLRSKSPSQHIRLLLSALVAGRPHAVSASVLGELIWGEEYRSGSLRVLVTRARSVLREAATQADIVVSGSGYQLAGPLSTDADLLQSVVAAAGRSPSGFVGKDAALRAVLDLWSGRPFDDIGEHPLAVSVRARLDQSRLSAEALLVLATEHSGRVGEALELVSSYLAEHRFDEALVHHAMRLHMRLGRQSEAIQTFRLYERILGEELGLVPSPNLKHLESAILRHEPFPEDHAFPDRRFAQPAVRGKALVRALRSRSSTGPVSTFQLIGRTNELATLQALLAERRLITVIGPPGVGKTRLATELAHQWPATVVWVDLAVHEQSQVVEAIASALGLSWAAEVDLINRIVHELSCRETLLIVDNCDKSSEVVREICEAVIDTCPAASIVCTSRTSLGARKEELMVLRGLSQEDSIALLRTRSSPRTSPGWQESDWHAAVMSCDGLPLAIELTAASMQLGTLPLLSRPQTARQALDVTFFDSFKRLGEVEQALLAHLGILSGPFDVEDAVALLENERSGPLVRRAELQPADRRRVRQALSSLVEHSLVSCEHNGSASWFRLLEPIREFALDRLEAAGRRPNAEQRHGEALLHSVKTEATRLWGPDEALAVDRLERIDGLILGVLRRGGAEHVGAPNRLGHLKVAMDLAVQLNDHAFMRSHDLYFAASGRLAMLEEAPSAASYGDVLGGLAIAAWARSDPALAQQHANGSLTWSRQAGVIDSRWALNALMAVEGTNGISERAIEFFGNVLAWNKAHGHDGHFSTMLVTMALGHAHHNDAVTGQAVAANALRRALATGSPSSIAWAEYACGYTAIAAGQDGAVEQLRVAIERAGSVRNTWVQGMAMSALAIALYRDGQWEESSQLLVSLMDHWRRANLVGQLGSSAALHALVEMSMGHAEVAAQSFAIHQGVGMQHPLLEHEAVQLKHLARRLPSLTQ